MGAGAAADASDAAMAGSGPRWRLLVSGVTISVPEPVGSGESEGAVSGEGSDSGEPSAIATAAQSSLQSVSQPYSYV